MKKQLEYVNIDVPKSYNDTKKHQKAMLQGIIMLFPNTKSIQKPYFHHEKNGICEYMRISISK